MIPMNWFFSVTQKYTAWPKQSRFPNQMIQMYWISLVTHKHTVWPMQSVSLITNYSCELIFFIDSKTYSMTKSVQVHKLNDSYQLIPFNESGSPKTNDSYELTLFSDSRIPKTNDSYELLLFSASQLKLNQSRFLTTYDSWDLIIFSDSKTKYNQSCLDSQKTNYSYEPILFDDSKTFSMTRIVEIPEINGS